MVQIPERLKGLRFIRVGARSKIPIDKKWQKGGGSNYGTGDEILIKHLESGGNYAIVTGIDNLFVIDADTQEIVDLVEEGGLGETFCVQTGSGGRHYYYYIDGFDRTKPIDKNGENVAHLKWVGSCVIGPGSVHPRGGVYSVLKDLEIKKIESEQVMFVFRNFLRWDEEVVKDSERTYTNDMNLPIDRVISLSGMQKRGDEYQGANPRHGSTTGMNFSVNPGKNLWKCWRHGTGGGTLHLIGMMNDIIDCESCKVGKVTGPEFKKILKVARERYGFVTEVDREKVYVSKPNLEGVNGCKNLEELYELTRNTIKTYMVIDEDDVKILALWAMGIAHKDDFWTYPELFLNASKGSGKSRLMKLLCAMIPRSFFVAGLSPAVMFRLPSQENASALFIDEANYNREELIDIRNVLLVGYKKGATIMRMSGKGSEQYAQSFPVYMGYVSANIKGFDDVISDRGITITLSKSNDPERTKLPEYFELDPWVRRISKTLSDFSGENDASDTLIANRGMQKIMQRLFKTVLEQIRAGLTNSNENTVISVVDDVSVGGVTSVTEIIEKIRKSKILARDYEVWSPLLLQAAAINQPLLEEIIKIAESRTANKDDEIDEDVNFALFLLDYVQSDEDHKKPTTCLKLRNAYVGADKAKEWLNSNHISAALRRLKCKNPAGRIGSARLLTINVENLEGYLTIRGYKLEELKSAKTDIPSPQGEEAQGKLLPKAPPVDVGALLKKEDFTDDKGDSP